ncbi:MAG TPA: TolC family protein [Gemmatimonadota bacterium]|jgi:outer membrane protein
MNRDGGVTRATVLAAILCALPLPASASQVDSLTLLDAVGRALSERPALGAAAAARDAARADRARVAGDWWPRLSLEAGLMRFEEPMLVSPLHGFDLRSIPDFDRTLVDAALGARWTLFEGGARLARARGAAAGVRAADAGLEATGDATIALTVATFADVVAARQTLEAHDLRLDALTAERDRVAKALAEGAVAGVDLSRADAALAGARADRVAAAAALEIATGDLARLVSLPEAGLAERLAVPALARGAAIVPDSAGAPAIEQARWQARAAAAASDAARAAWWPEVSTRGAWIERGAALDRDTYTNEWQIGLRLDWALFTGGARAAAISRADAERVRAEELLAQAELDQDAAVQRARSALELAEARAQALEQAVAARAEVARVERLSLDVGAGVQADWLDAEADLLDARAALVRSRADALVAAVELARATGALDLDWLATRLEEAP